jgi:hypothetical protein
VIVQSPSPYHTLTHVLEQHAARQASSRGDSSTSSSSLAAAGIDANQPSVVLCCGTFFIMSDIRRALSLQYAIDPVMSNEQSMAK